MMYLALNPALKGAKSSAVCVANFSAEGKEKPPSIFSPKFSQSLSIIPLILGMLLFCEIMNEQIASQGSWFKIRIPLYFSAAAFKTLFSEMIFIILA